MGESCRRGPSTYNYYFLSYLLNADLQLTPIDVSHGSLTLGKYIYFELFIFRWRGSRVLGYPRWKKKVPPDLSTLTSPLIAHRSRVRIALLTKKKPQLLCFRYSHTVSNHLTPSWNTYLFAIIIKTNFFASVCFDFFCLDFFVSFWRPNFFLFANLLHFRLP